MLDCALDSVKRKKKIEKKKLVFLINWQSERWFIKLHLKGRRNHGIQEPHITPFLRFPPDLFLCYLLIDLPAYWMCGESRGKRKEINNLVNSKLNVIHTHKRKQKKTHTQNTHKTTDALTYRRTNAIRLLSLDNLCITAYLLFLPVL